MDALSPQHLWTEGFFLVSISEPILTLSRLGGFCFILVTRILSRSDLLAARDGLQGFTLLNNAVCKCGNLIFRLLAVLKFYNLI